jgi:translation initiation factor 1
MPSTPSTTTTPSAKAARGADTMQRWLDHFFIDGMPESDEAASLLFQEKFKSLHRFVQADDDSPVLSKQTQDEYIHIRIQRRKGHKTLTTFQGLRRKSNQKKILEELKKKLACNVSVITDKVMGEVIQLQGDQRKEVQEFLVAKKDGLGLDPETIKVHGF